MLNRRRFLQTAALAAAAPHLSALETKPNPKLLDEFAFSDVSLAPGLAQSQFDATQKTLLALNNDSILKPWRMRAGVDAPGGELGGWYDEGVYVPKKDNGHFFAPANSTGQWVSAMARGYAINGDAATKQKVHALLDGYSTAVSPAFYKGFAFPMYNYDKWVIGILDAAQYTGYSGAKQLLARTTDAAEPSFSPTALDRGAAQAAWRKKIGEPSNGHYTGDESYTNPENLYLAASYFSDPRYSKLARRFLLDETWFDPLSRNENIIHGHHAYSFTNSLSSGIQAYLSDGSEKHLRASTNAFRMIREQSYATGGWGPKEHFVVPGTDELYASLSNTHNSFETPCGSYAHFKAARYLLRITGDASYGDSIEQVFYNTVLGAKPLTTEGKAFYYADNAFNAKKVYYGPEFPCCSGTLPQVTADYRKIAYFHDARGLYVNMYEPSAVKFTSPAGAQCSLTQQSNYPLQGDIRFRLTANRASTFAMRFRIPAWSPTHSIRVNGQPVSAQVVNGWATVSRAWKNGDTVELALALATRLAPLDGAHADTVAIMRGPLVLMALGENPPAMTREQMLQISAQAENTFAIKTDSGTIKLAPFTSIHDETYNTYLKLKQS